MDDDILFPRKIRQRRYTDFTSILNHPNITNFNIVKQKYIRHTNFFEKPHLSILSQNTSP